MFRLYLFLMLHLIKLVLKPIVSQFSRYSWYYMVMEARMSQTESYFLNGVPNRVKFGLLLKTFKSISMIFKIIINDISY